MRGSQRRISGSNRSRAGQFLRSRSVYIRGAGHFCAVIISAWFGGMGPGLLAVGLSGIACQHVLVHPVGAQIVDASQDPLRLLVFVLVGLFTNGRKTIVKWLSVTNGFPVFHVKVKAWGGAKDSIASLGLQRFSQLLAQF